LDIATLHLELRDMTVSAISLRTLSAAALLVVAARSTHAHAGGSPASQSPKHPVACAKGVRIYTDKSQLPTPYDTLTLPPTDGPIRVTSPEEAEAAELDLRRRAGSVGATAVLVTDEVTDDGGGNQRVRRQATAVFVPADSARAQQACK